MGTVPRGEQGQEHRDLSERDLLQLKLMLRENTSWVATCHNGHITGLQRVGPALHAGDLPTWWLAYFVANNIPFES